MNLDLYSNPQGIAAPNKGEARKMLKHLEGDDYILQIDNSTLEVASTCARAAEYQIVEGRVPIPRGALLYGGAIHLGLEEYYRGGDRRAVFTETLKGFEKTPLVEDWRTPDRALECMSDYMSEYPRERETFKPLVTPEGKQMVEIPFSIPLGEVPMNTDVPFSPGALVEGFTDRDSQLYIDTVHVFWTGKIDMVVEIPPDKWVLDHKTTSVLGPTYFEDFVLSQQTVGYTWATEKILGEPVKGLLLNVIMGRPRSKSGVSQEFQRRRFIYPRHRLDEWPVNTLYLCADLLSYLARGYFPRMTKWCIGKYGKCKYHDVCSADPDLRNSILHSDSFENNTWSPLTH